MIVGALFDSGNGCYQQASIKFPELELYSIGLDKENKNSHFIHLNLASYSITKKNHPLFDKLDKLPKPDLILASPPCESWSTANSMWGGNACWKQEDLNSLFESQIPLSKFTIRDYRDYEKLQYNPENQIITRINGELCIFNTIQIIKRYKPKYYVIENPAFFGWNSGGIGKKYGFEIEKIILIAHGGWHNDTIITIEKKV